MKAIVQDQKENIRDAYEQGLLLSFKNKKIENEYFLHIASNYFLNCTIVAGMLLFLVLCSIITGSLMPVCSGASVLLIAFSIYFRVGSLKKIAQYFIVWIFQIHMKELSNVVLLLEFTLHLLYTEKLRDFLIMTLIKELSFNLVSKRILDYALISITLILIKKDHRDFWILNNYFMNLAKESKILLNSANTGYFMTDEHGNILEKNSTGEKILSLANSTLTPQNLQETFPPYFCLRLFSMIEKAQKGHVPEEEFLHIFSNSSSHQPFSSMLIKIVPTFNSEKNSFLLILKDISHCIATRNAVALTFKENYLLIKEFKALVIERHITNKCLIGTDKALILASFSRQLEQGVMLGWMIGVAELKLSSFFIKPEVINIIHLSWENWIGKSIKIHFLCENDIPCVRTDNIKHNHLVNAMLEFALYHADEHSEVLIVISRFVNYI